MSGSRGGVSVSISVVDRATRQINAINRQLNNMRAPATRLATSLTRMYDLTGLNGLVRGMDVLGSYSMNAFRGVSRLATAMLGLTGTASVVGMFKLVTGWANLTNQATLAGMRVGMSAGNLQAWDKGAQLAGASAGSMTAAMTNLNDILNQVSISRDPAHFRMLTALFPGHPEVFMNKTAEQFLPTLIDRLRQIPQAAKRAEAANDLLGGQFFELQRVINEGSDALANNMEVARRHGVVTAEQEKAAYQLVRSQAGLTQSLQGLSMVVSSALSPVLSKYLDELSVWIDKNRDVLAQDLASHVDKFAKALEQHDWGKAITEFQAGVDVFGLWGKAAEALGAILVLRVVAPLLQIVGALTKLSAITLPAGILRVLGLKGLGAAGLFAWLMKPTPIDPNNTNQQTLEHPESLGADPEVVRQAGLGNVPTGFGPFGAATGFRPATEAERNVNHPAIDREKQAREDFSYVTTHGLSKVAGSAFIAQEQQESGFDQNAVGDNGLARGVFQWHPDRQAAFERIYGHDMAHGTRQEQLQFAIGEWSLFGSRARQGREIMEAKTATQASNAMTVSEAPADTAGEMIRRGGLAEQWDKILNPHVEVKPTPAPPINIAGGTGAAPAPPPANMNAPKGTADININLGGFPESTRTTASATGSLFSAPPKIVHTMSGALAP